LTAFVELVEERSLCPSFEGGICFAFHQLDPWLSSLGKKIPACASTAAWEQNKKPVEGIMGPAFTELSYQW